MYAILLGEPKNGTVTIKSLAPKAGATMHILGSSAPVAWSQVGDDIKVTFATPVVRYAWVLKIEEF